MAERTGCPVLLSLWSYVTDITLFGDLYCIAILKTFKKAKRGPPLYSLHALPLVTSVYGLMTDGQTYP